MAILLSNRVQSIKPSPTLTISAKASELKAQGKDIISLSAGEPDFDTPDHIKDQAVTAINDGHTKYTSVGGVKELKQAICTKLQRDNNLSYDVENILVSTGAKQSIYNAMQALLNPGDEVIIPAPYWVSYPDMVKLTGATPVFIESTINERFKITPEKLAAAITPKTKLLLLNSPSNPSGMAYTKTELQQLATILLKHPHVIILSDDIYEYILWGQEFANIATICPELQQRCIVINGVSKAYSMTGWRIGYAAAESSIIKAMTKIQGQSTSNPCSISQYAALAAITASQQCVTDMVKTFKKRHDYMVEELNNITGISCLPGNGTFYCFFQVTDLIANIPAVNNDTELAAYLLEELNLALVPGTAFGAPGYLRLSFATSDSNLQTAITRLQQL